MTDVDTIKKLMSHIFTQHVNVIKTSNITKE